MCSRSTCSDGHLFERIGPRRDGLPGQRGLPQKVAPLQGSHGMIDAVVAAADQPNSAV